MGEGAGEGKGEISPQAAGAVAAGGAREGTLGDLSAPQGAFFVPARGFLPGVGPLGRTASPPPASTPSSAPNPFHHRGGSRGTAVSIPTPAPGGGHGVKASASSAAEAPKPRLPNLYGGPWFPAASPGPDIWSSLCLAQWKHFMLI